MVRRKKTRPKLSEVDLAVRVISWLEADGWDVYQEVDGADIVAVRHSVLWVIECKIILGFPVLEQAMHWRTRAHSVLVATAPRRTSRNVVKSFCSYAGIGWIEVPTSRTVNILVRPEFNRKAKTERLSKLLRPEHKTYAAAGSPTGRAWTPFKETCRDLLRFVRKSPGVSMKEALSSIKHHYNSGSSAVRSLSKMIDKGVVPGIRQERQGRSIFLFPNE